MFILKPRSRNRYGFTLIELILFMAISSLLILTFFSVLSFNTRVSEKILLEDEMLLNGRYAIEYIKERLITADKVILSHHFEGLDKKFPTNIGFVIVEHSYIAVNKSDKEFDIAYNYSTYYFDSGKLIRIATANYTVSKTLPYHGLFKGYNEVIACTLEDSKISLEDNKLVKFDISLGKDNKKVANFKTTINLRCPVVP